MAVRHYSEAELLGIISGLESQTLHRLENIEKLLSFVYKYPRGMTLTSVIHLKKGAPITYIDFLDNRRFRNIPLGDSVTGGLDTINTRNMPVSRLILYNLGPGGMYFDTNVDYGTLTVDTPITVNSSWEIMSDYPSIFSVALAADSSEAGDDAKVRMTAIV